MMGDPGEEDGATGDVGAAVVGHRDDRQGVACLGCPVEVEKLWWAGMGYGRQ